jgi:proline iminopeptidase
MSGAQVLLGILIATSVGCRDQAAPRVPPHGYVTGAGGAQIFYEVVGSGDDTVVVVHGGPGAGINDSRPDLEPLAKDRVVIFYDQRGGGRSELPDTMLLSPGHFVGDLEAVREHFGLEQMSLVAQSFGALIVAEYLRAHPIGSREWFFSSQLVQTEKKPLGSTGDPLRRRIQPDSDCSSNSYAR